MAASGKSADSSKARPNFFSKFPTHRKLFHHFQVSCTMSSDPFVASLRKFSDSSVWETIGMWSQTWNRVWFRGDAMTRLWRILARLTFFSLSDIKTAGRDRWPAKESSCSSIISFCLRVIGSSWSTSMKGETLPTIKLFQSEKTIRISDQDFDQEKVRLKISKRYLYFHVK